MTELGRKLKEARESKGMSLADIQEVTKIQKRYLAGIEEGNYEIMPGKFYVRAFIKQYAEAVGLSSEELFEEFKSEVPSSIEDDVPLRSTGAAGEAQPARVKSSKRVSDSSKLLDYLPRILVVGFIIGALFLVWVLIPKGGSESEPPVDEEVQVQEDPAVEEPVVEEPVDEEPIVEEPPAPVQTLTAVSTSGRQTVYELAGTDSFEVSISSKGETWIELADANGKNYYSGMLANGQTQTHNLTGQTEAQIVVGFAPDTTIMVNGEALVYKLPAADEVRQDIVIRMKAQ